MATNKLVAIFLYLFSEAKLTQPSFFY